MWPDDKEVTQQRPVHGPPVLGRPSTDSDVITFDERNIPVDPTPRVSQMNVYKSKVHLGPKIEVHNNGEIIKGRFFGLDIVQAKHSHRFRCSVAVFVCWAFVVATGLTIYLMRITLSKQTRLDLGIKENWYFRRADWQAMPAYEEDFLSLPVKYVVVGHSATPYCSERYDCTEKILAIQQDHLIRGFNDIGPNFLVSGKGLIFEGRGANVIGAFLNKWNTKIISIMFLGDYTKDQPDVLQFADVNILLDYLLKHKVLESDYVLYGKCQITTETVSPGPNIMKSLHNFSHWDPVNKNECIPG